MKRNKGITLIALVITIVVLIILAGVAITLSLGENGIFNKAKFATEEYTNEQAREEMEIADLEYQIDIISQRESQIDKEEILKGINLVKENTQTAGARGEITIDITLDKGIYILFVNSAYSGGDYGLVVTSNNPKPEVSGCKIIKNIDDYIYIIEVENDETKVQSTFMKGMPTYTTYKTFYRIAAYQ